MGHRTRIKDPRALILLIALLACLFSFPWLMARGQPAAPGDRPPVAPFLAAGAAVLTLFVAKRLKVARPDEPTSEGATLVELQRKFAWLYLMERYWRPIAGVAALIFSLFVLRRLPLMGLEDHYGQEALAWMLSILLYVAAVVPREQLSLTPHAWWRGRLKLVGTVIFIVSVALLVRVWALAEIPFTLSGDEGSQGLEAVRVIEGKIRNPFSTGWLGVPTMSFFFNSVTIRLFGRTVTALRLPWALLGVMTVLVTFFLVKRLKGTPLALITAALLATYHFHIHFSRLGSNQIADPFFMSLALLFLARALAKGKRRDWVLMGVISGLALYFYAGARLTPVVILAVLAYEFVRAPKRFLRGHGAGVLIALGGFMVTAAPMVQYAIRFPNDFNARLNQVGIIQSGWIPKAMELRGESMAAVLYDQFLRAALAFNYFPDRTVWYGLRQPLLSPFFGGIFLLGLGYGTLRLLGRSADKRLAPMVAWWWGGMILGGMLTESPPSSQRLITLAVPVSFFIALAMWETIRLARKGAAGLAGNAMFALLVLLFAVSSLATYFLEYSPRRIYGGPYAELATMIAPRLNEVKGNHRIYFVGAPHMYWGIATLPYLVPDADAIDVTISIDDLIANDPTLQKKGAVFIFIPQRIEELGRVQQLLPGGEVQEFYSPVDGRIMVTLYEVDKPG